MPAISCTRRFLPDLRAFRQSAHSSFPRIGSWQCFLIGFGWVLDRFLYVFCQFIHEIVVRIFKLVFYLLIDLVMDTFVILVFPDRIEATVLGGDKQIRFQGCFDHKISRVSQRKSINSCTSSSESSSEIYWDAYSQRGE